MTRSGLARRLAVPAVLATVAMITFTGAGPASAHAFLVSSNPSDGQVLDVAPTELRLRLSEPVLLGSTSITLVGGPARLELSDLRVVELDGTPSAGAGSAAAPGGGTGVDEAPIELVAPLPPLERGSYRVSVETVSADDLHRTAAVLVFGVQEQVSAAGRQEAEPKVGEALLRWVVLTGLCLGLGSGLVRRLTRPARHPSMVRVAVSADQVAAAACCLAAVTCVALLAIQVAGEGAAGLGALRGAYAVRWLTREAGLLLLGLAAAMRWRQIAPRVAVVAFGAGAVLGPLGEAVLGHAGAGASTSWSRVVATGLHIWAASTWAGGAVLLTGCVLVLCREGVPGRALARALLRRFGVPAAGCVSVMVVTGLFLASSVVASVDAALVTTYGKVLLAKVLLTGLALLLGLAHSLSLHPRLRIWRRGAGTASITPGRSLVVEGGAVVAALALAALLSAGQPAVGPGLVRDPATGFKPTVSAFAGDLQEQLSIQPNRPGPNIAVVTLASTRRPDPAPVTGVSLSVHAAGGGLRSVGTGELSAPGQWSIPVTISEAGPASAVVVVTRAGTSPTVLPVDWMVAHAAPTPTLVSLAPVATWLRAASSALALTLAIIWGLGALHVLRRRRRAPVWAVEAAIYSGRSPSHDQVPTDRDLEPSHR